MNNSPYFYLTDDELKDLLRAYYIDNKSSKSVIKEFFLDDYSGTFLHNIPPLKSTQICPICSGSCVFTEAKPFSFGMPGKAKKSLENCYSYIECAQCKHHIGQDHNCDCEKCYYERLDRLPLQDKVDFIATPLGTHKIVSVNSAEGAIQYLYMAVRKFQNEYSSDIYIYAYPIDSGNSISEKEFYSMLHRRNKRSGKKIFDLALPGKMIKTLEKYFNALGSLEINFKILKDSDNENQLFIATHKNGVTLSVDKVFQKSLSAQVFTSAWLKNIVGKYNKKFKERKSEKNREFKSDNPDAITEYIKNIIYDFEFDKDVSQNSDKFDFELLGSAIKNSVSDEITISSSIDEDTGNLVFSSYGLFDTEGFLYCPYKPRVLSESLERNSVIPEFRKTPTLSALMGCSKCGAASGSAKFHDSEILCLRCFNLLSTAVRRASHTTPDGRILTGAEADRERAFERKQIQIEKDLKDGTKFKCVVCRKAVKIGRMSKVKNICTSCVKFHVDNKEFAACLTNHKQIKALEKEKLTMLAEEKAEKSKKDEDMIAKFLREKAEREKLQDNQQKGDL